MTWAVSHDMSTNVYVVYTKCVMLTDVRKIASIIRLANRLPKACTKDKIQYRYTTNHLVVSEHNNTGLLG
jgi:hypothetical protein